MTYHTIRLTISEMMLGVNVGVMRQTLAIKKQRQQEHGADDENDWQKHILGALGEQVFAKFMGVYWCGDIGNLQVDVGDWEVRTRSKHHYDLTIYPKDKDNSRYALVTGDFLEWRVHGWIYGKDAKKESYWREYTKGRPGFFVPKRVLQPFTKQSEVAA